MNNLKAILFSILLLATISNCTSVQISNPHTNTLVAIEGQGSSCSEYFRKKQFYLLFGTVPLNSIKQSEMFGDGKASYQIEEKATWVDFLISVMGGQLISLSSKTIIVKKCDGKTILNYDAKLNKNLEENKKQFEEKYSKDYSEKMEILKKEQEKFNKEKESLILSAIEKMRYEFEKEYAAKRNAALDEIVKKRLEEIELEKKSYLASLDEKLNKGKTDETTRKKFEDELKISIRKELETEFIEKLNLEKEKIHKTISDELNKKNEIAFNEKLIETEKNFYKKREREISNALNGFFKSNPQNSLNSELTTVILKNGKIHQGRLSRFEADFVHVEINGELKKFFVKEIVKVVFPKKNKN